MKLTPDQLNEISAIIRDYHTAFMIAMTGEGSSDPEVLKAIERRGIEIKELGYLRDSYLYGHAIAQSDSVAGMSYEQFKQHIKANPIPLSNEEQNAAQYASMNAAQHIKGLGNKIDTFTKGRIIAEDRKLRAEMEGTIRSETAKNIANRESFKQLKSDLGWAYKDWARDWDRIAVTEKTNAMLQGVADEYRKEFGSDALVYKIAMPDACKHCKELHNGPDGNPIVYKLVDLEANGTNVGRKAKDWKATVGPVHPHCQCQLVRLPQGWGFDEDGDVVPGGDFKLATDVEKALVGSDDLRKAVYSTSTIRFQGLPIAIENKPGSIRSWSGGQTRMQYAYGYVMRTIGADEDEIDVYVGPYPAAENVYIMHQQNPETGIYDEEKCMLGFLNEQQARSAYLMHYDRSDFLVACTPMPIDQFKRWIAETENNRDAYFFQKEIPESPESGKGKFVIPLQKSMTQSNYKTVDGGRTNSALRRNPSYGTSANYFLGAREVDRDWLQYVIPDIKDMYSEILDGEGVDKRFKRDKEDYHIMAPVHTPVHTNISELPDAFTTNNRLGTGEADDNRQRIDTHVKNRAKANIDISHDTVTVIEGKKNVTDDTTK